MEQAQQQEVAVCKDTAKGSANHGAAIGSRVRPQEKERGPSVSGWQTIPRWQQDASETLKVQAEFGALPSQGKSRFVKIYKDAIKKGDYLTFARGLRTIGLLLCRVLCFFFVFVFVYVFSLP